MQGWGGRRRHGCYVLCASCTVRASWGWERALLLLQAGGLGGANSSGLFQLTLPLPLLFPCCGRWRVRVPWRADDDQQGRSQGHHLECLGQVKVAEQRGMCRGGRPDVPQGCARSLLPCHTLDDFIRYPLGNSCIFTIRRQEARALQTRKSAHSHAPSLPDGSAERAMDEGVKVRKPTRPFAFCTRSRCRLALLSLLGWRCRPAQSPRWRVGHNPRERARCSLIEPPRCGTGGLGDGCRRADGPACRPFKRSAADAQGPTLETVPCFYVAAHPRAGIPVTI